MTDITKRLAEALRLARSYMSDSIDYGSPCAKRDGDLVDEVLAAYRAHAGKASGWQPIETAPRDGTPVDLWHKAGFRQTETWWDADDACWSSVNDDDAFTHWMPLPDPPEQST